MERIGVEQSLSPTRRDTQSGMSLIECLAALLLLSLALLAVVPMFVQAIEDNTVNADLGVAGGLAVERMEQLRQEDFTSAVLAPGGNLEANAAGYFDASEPGYVVRWTVGTHPSLSHSKVVTVRDRSTRSPVGTPKQVTLTSVRGE